MSNMIGGAASRHLATRRRNSTTALSLAAARSLAAGGSGSSSNSATDSPLRPLAALGKGGTATSRGADGLGSSGTLAVNKPSGSGSPRTSSPRRRPRSSSLTTISIRMAGIASSISPPAGRRELESPDTPSVTSPAAASPSKTSPSVPSVAAPTPTTTGTCSTSASAPIPATFCPTVPCPVPSYAGNASGGGSTGGGVGGGAPVPASPRRMPLIDRRMSSKDSSAALGLPNIDEDEELKIDFQLVSRVGKQKKKSDDEMQEERETNIDEVDESEESIEKLENAKRPSLETLSSNSSLNNGFTKEIRASVASNNKQQQRSSSTRSSANARHAEGHKYPRRRSTPCDTVVRVDNDGTSFKCSVASVSCFGQSDEAVDLLDDDDNDVAADDDDSQSGRAAVARGRQKPRASSLDAAIYSTTAAAGIPLLRDSYAQSALRKHSLPASIYDDHGALLAAAMTDPGAGSLFHHNEHGDEAGPVVPHPGAASVGSSGRPVKHVRLSVPNEGSVCGAGGRRNSARSRRRRAVGTQDYKSCALVQTRLKLGDIMLDNLS